MKVVFSRVVSGIGLSPVMIVEDLPEETNRIMMYNRLLAAFRDDELLKTTCALDKSKWDAIEVII